MEAGGKMAGAGTPNPKTCCCWGVAGVPPPRAFARLQLLGWVPPLHAWAVPTPLPWHRTGYGKEIENGNERKRKLPCAKAVINELQTRTEEKLEQEMLKLQRRDMSILA